MAPLMRDGCAALRRDASFISGVEPADFKVHCAGTPCIDWSKRGKKMQSYGATCVPHAIWLAQVIASDIHILVHECTPDYPDFMLMDALHFYSSRQWSICVLRMCPSDMGIPVKRRRRYSVVWRADKVAFNGSFGHFVELFFRECTLTGDIFFRNGEDIANTDSKTKHQSLQMYREIRDESMSKSPVEANMCIADLQQRPPFGSLDKFVPTLATSSAIYNLSRNRFLTQYEKLDVIGVPQDSPLAKLLRAGKLSDGTLRKLMGNTMSIPCVGTALLYVLCCCPAKRQSCFLKPSVSREF